ncbi:MAG: phosphoglycerol transferase [Paracoccaceae bacterium]
MTSPRRIFAISWLSAIGLLALGLLAFPAFPAPSPGQAIIIVVVTLLVMFGYKLWRGASRLTWLVVLAGLMILPFGIVARGFGRVDTLAFLFHFQFGTQGATLAGLEDAVSTAVIAVLLLLVVTIGLSKLLQRGRLVSMALAFALFICNPGLRYGLQRLIEGPFDSGLQASIVSPSLQATLGPQPDVLLLYLEGFERRYLELPMFQDTADKMQQILGQATSFQDVRQVAGTGWSVAGVVATQCGVPPVPNGLVFGDGFEKQSGFLTGRTCLSDVLANAGYRNAFVVGSELEFGGLLNFLESHSFGQIAGIEEIRAAFPPDEFDAANLGWNVDDQMVFEMALRRHGALLGTTDPYLLVVETYSLHDDEAITSRRCNGNAVAERTSDIVHAAACAADDVGLFLRAFEEQQGSRPVRIIVMSDHLSHYDGADLGMPQIGRRNLVEFIDDGQAGATIQKTGTMLDVYPTILDWLDLFSGPEQAGLGVSLFSDLPTLVEQYGEDALSEAFLKDAGLAVAIWSDG